jgi:hypothetical protein
LTHPFWRHELLHPQQLKLFAERQKVGKERVEVRFDREVEDLLEMGVVQVSEDPEEVFVDVLGGVGE